MAKTPKIRFKNFSDEWVENKLGNISDITTGKLNANAMKEDGKYDFYTSGIQKYKIDIPAFEGPAITIAGNGATVGYMYLADGKFNAYQRTYVLLNFKENRIFLFFEIKNKLSKKIAQEARAGNIPYIVLDMLTNLEIFTPIAKEQQKIGAFFSKFDKLIALHQSKFEKLQKIKKSCLQNLFPQNNQNTPKIRFTSFSKSWETRKFSDTFIFLQNNSLSRAELSNLDGEIINIHYGDILIKYTEILNIKTNDLTYILDNSIIKKYQASTLQNGDIIIADAAEDQTVGKCSEITGLTNEVVLSGLHTIPCRPNEKHANGFLGYYMNSNVYHNQLLPLLQGTKVLSISKSALQNTDIIYPSNLAEQCKISDFFSKLDKLILLHQSKFEKLQKIKKSCLQNMFV